MIPRVKPPDWADIASCDFFDPVAVERGLRRYEAIRYWKMSVVAEAPHYAETGEYVQVAVVVVDGRPRIRFDRIWLEDRP